MRTAISWSFLSYFIILFAERTQSLIRTFTSDNFKYTTFGNHVNFIAILSLACTLFLLIGFNPDFWKSLFIKDIVPNYTVLTITAGVLLVSGMVHTDHTIPALQFVSYGALIIGMILQTIINVNKDGASFNHWFSLIYLVSFSMAIPVMYRSNIVYNSLFHAIEAFASFFLVVVFTYMLMMMFTGSGKDLLRYIPLFVMCILDATIIAMRWRESVNHFVLIFAGLTVVLFIAGRIIFSVSR